MASPHEVLETRVVSTLPLPPIVNSSHDNTTTPATTVDGHQPAAAFESNQAVYGGINNNDPMESATTMAAGISVDAPTITDKRCQTGEGSILSPFLNDYCEQKLKKII
jgi:hypothetical protein